MRGEKKDGFPRGNPSEFPDVISASGCLLTQKERYRRVTVPMEKNRSSDLQNLPPSSKREIAYPSLVQRAMRSILTPILFGGAIATTAVMPSVDVEAKDPVKEERKEEDPLLTKLRQEIPALIADLDSNKFLVREQAQKRLQQIAVEWVTREQKPFPLVSLLQGKDGYSLEQQRRLERVLAVHEHEELQLLWRPTIFQEPLEWQGRKDPPRVREALTALEQQTGKRVILRWAENFADNPVPHSLHGKTFWELLTLLEKSARRPFDIYQSFDSTFSIYLEQPGVRAINGNVLGRAYTRKRNPTDQQDGRRTIQMSVIAESLPLADLTIMKAEGVTNTGRRIDLKEQLNIDPLGRVWPRTPGTWTNLTLPEEKGEQNIDLTVTVLLHGYDLRKPQLVLDLKKPTTFRMGNYDLHITGVSKSQPGESEYWSVNAQLNGRENECEQWCLINAMRCQAFDAQGRPIEIAGFSGNAGEWGWHFRAQPSSIQLLLPGRSTSIQKTLVFNRIPLN